MEVFLISIIVIEFIHYIFINNAIIRSLKYIPISVNRILKRINSNFTQSRYRLLTLKGVRFFRYNHPHSYNIIKKCT